MMQHSFSSLFLLFIFFVCGCFVLFLLCLSQLVDLSFPPFEYTLFMM